MSKTVMLQIQHLPICRHLKFSLPQTQPSHQVSRVFVGYSQTNKEKNEAETQTYSIVLKHEPSFSADRKRNIVHTAADFSPP